MASLPFEDMEKAASGEALGAEMVVLFDGRIPHGMLARFRDPRHDKGE